MAQIWPVCFILFIYLLSRLPCGLPMACLWPKFGKQERTAQVPSFFSVCGPEQGVGFAPELKSMGPRFETVLLDLVYSWLPCGLPLAYLWPKFGKQERTAQVPYSSQYVGQSKVLDMGRIWARIKINGAQI